MRRIRENFLTQNLIGGVVENHVDAFLGREPEFDLGAAPATDALTRWYYAQNVQATLYAAACTLLYAVAGTETSSMLRLFVPRRAAPDGTMLKGPLEAQLLKGVRLQHVPTSRAGTLREDGDTVAAYYLYSDLDEAGQQRNVLEFVALDTEFALQRWERRDGVQSVRGDTVIQLRTGTDYGTILSEGVYPLGGHLTLYEMRRRPLISSDVVSQQAGLNTQLTYVNRHSGAAAFLERVILNGVPPGHWVNEAGESDPNGQIYKPDDYQTGPGTTNFIGGVDYGDNERTTASIKWREPSSSANLLEVVEFYRKSIFDLCNQSHRLISGDSTASGVARVMAAADFANSLRPSETAVKAGAAWTLETALRLGGYLETGGERYTDLTADVKLSVQAVTPTPEEQRLWIELRDAGVFDDAELMARAGVQDTAAMAARVKTQRLERQQEAQNVA